MKSFTNDLIKKIILQIRQEENMMEINKEILQPLMNTLTNRIYPYVTLLFALYLINIIVIVIILILILIKKNV